MRRTDIVPGKRYHISGLEYGPVRTVDHMNGQTVLTVPGEGGDVTLVVMDFNKIKDLGYQ